MQPYLSALGQASIAVLIMMFGVWLISLWKRNAGIIDIFWSLGFVLVSGIYFFRAGGAEGNWIGTNPAGTDLGNGEHGIRIGGAQFNTVGGIAGANGRFYAGRRMTFEHFVFDTCEGRFDRLHLIENVYAIAVVLDHAGDALHLTGNTIETVEKRGLIRHFVCGYCAH